MSRQYFVTPNVSGTSGLLPQGIRMRNVFEAVLTGGVTGLLTIGPTGGLPPVIRASIVILFCVVPTIIAVTGLYSMSLFQFLSVLSRRNGKTVLYMRFPTEEKALETLSAAEKKKRGSK